MVNMATARKPRAKRSDSAAAAIDAMLNAGKMHAPPVHAKLRPEHAPFWQDIMKSRAFDEWTDADLVLAAQLARAMRDVEVHQDALEVEGAMVEDRFGAPMKNPRTSLLADTQKLQLALMRSLRMGGIAAGPARELQGKRKVERQSRALRDELEDDPLLA